MCESHAYLLKVIRKNSLENVDRVQPLDDGHLVLEDIFGQRKMIEPGSRIGLVDHKIILEEV